MAWRIIQGREGFMTPFHSFIFGLLQGITEFLPVSSSAHLKLLKILMGTDTSEGQVIFDLVCHLGTLSAVLCFFFKEILQLFTSDRKNLKFLLIATLPLVPCYLLLKPIRDIASAPECLGFCLICTSAILFLGHQWRPQRIRQTPPEPPRRLVRDAVMIGTMQSAALIPGISRSASTISCAQILGWQPRDAVRFSFLLSIPTIIGGNCFELLKLYFAHEHPPLLSASSYTVAFLTSGIVGFIVIRFAINILQKGHLKPFAWYCLILGIITTVYLNIL